MKKVNKIPKGNILLGIDKKGVSRNITKTCWWMIDMKKMIVLIIGFMFLIGCASTSPKYSDNFSNDLYSCLSGKTDISYGGSFGNTTYIISETCNAVLYDTNNVSWSAYCSNNKVYGDGTLEINCVDMSTNEIITMTKKPDRK